MISKWGIFLAKALANDAQIKSSLNFFWIYIIDNLSRGLPFIIASKSPCLSKIKYLILSFVDTYMY